MKLRELIKTYNLQEKVRRIEEVNPNKLVQLIDSCEVLFKDVIESSGCYTLARFLCYSNQIEMLNMLRDNEKVRRKILAHEIAHLFDWALYSHLGHGSTWGTIMLRMGFDCNMKESISILRR